MMGSDLLLQGQTSLTYHMFNHIDSMTLKCAVELGIPGIIHNHGSPISLPELATALDIPPTKHSHLGRLMRVLTHSGIFSAQKRDDDDDVVYLLTPLSGLLVENEAGSGLSPFLLAMLDPVVLNPFRFMGAWFRDNDAPTPFAVAHGCGLWDKTAGDPDFNKVFNAGMACDASFSFDFLVKESGEVFKGLRSLVDVGGGTGVAARAISEAFPEVKCTVLELPNVVDDAPKDGNVTFFAGDMFHYVPPADAVLLKCILHDLGEEDCVKILRRCKEAIPAKEEGGKVIIIDLVVGSKNSHPKAKESQLYWDMMMMVLCGGVEREEHEWGKIFTDAGFTDYTITPALGLRSIIEVYP